MLTKISMAVLAGAAMVKCVAAAGVTRTVWSMRKDASQVLELRSWVLAGVAACASRTLVPPEPGGATKTQRFPAP